MYRRFPGAEWWSAVPGIFAVLRLLLCDRFGFDVYAVKRPIGRAAITCGDDLKGIGDMPQQAV